jgi:methylated-DNA-[protein]-cysteine S-methyltransferase
MQYCYLDSAIGPLLIAGDENAVQVISFPKDGAPTTPEPGWIESTDAARGGALGEAVRQLREYFTGRRTEFDFPMQPQGTPFQLAVWKCLTEIPYGETISYGELAKRVGNPKAARAVGAANGANPLPIVVPCHRVIGANGKLTGFGGGLPTKEKLLALEKNA